MRLVLIAVSLVVLFVGSAAKSADSVYVYNESWRCLGPVDLDLVKVEVDNGSGQIDAIVLGKNCTGRIGRVEVDTNGADGIKVQNAGNVAHDLSIGREGGGYVHCSDAAPLAHQDAMQAMGGFRIAMFNLSLDCTRNSNFFVNKAGSMASTPTDITCDGCSLGPNSASSLFIGNSIRSGVRNSTICGNVRITPAAVDPVNENNIVVPESECDIPPNPPPPAPPPAPPPPCTGVCKL